MKKTLVSMVTGALVIGAASTTFAAANPFSDVPANSWAYDAVAKLAADGVVNGFPDGTFRGNEDMTRYQMAQIVAKAMTYENLTKADKALVDKLAAEFANELNNLGVRVGNLEKKSDNVKWTGNMQYTYAKVKMPTIQNNGRYFKGDGLVQDNKYTFELTPTAFIPNTNWTAHARIRYYNNANAASNDNNNTNTDVDRIYVQGPLFGSQATLGKFETISGMGTGMIMDDNISGAQFTRKAGNVNITTAIGKYQYDSSQNENSGQSQNAFDGSGTYTAIELGYAPKESKVSAMAGYYSLRNIKNNSSSMANFFDVADTNGPTHPVLNPNFSNSTAWNSGIVQSSAPQAGSDQHPTTVASSDSNPIVYDTYTKELHYYTTKDNTVSNLSEFNKNRKDIAAAIKNMPTGTQDQKNAKNAAQNLLGSSFYPGNGNGESNDNIWSVGAGYKFDNNVNMYAVYAKSNLDAPSTYLGDDQSKAYDITVNYKGVNPQKAGSWGAHVAYRYLGSFATIDPTYNGAQRGTKGWEIGTDYAVASNIIASLVYFDGKTLATDFGNNDADYTKLYGNIKFMF